jgi:hypothetical protein
LQRFVTAAVSEGRLRVIEIGPEDVALFENWNEPK